MIAMESAHWRSYRRHLIIARKTFLGLRRYDVWKRGQLIGTFRDVIEAELHVDAAIMQEGEGHDQADPSARERLATLTMPERTVLEAIAQGRSLKASAATLGLSTREAQEVRKDLFAKIGVDTATEARRVGRYGGISQQRDEGEPSA